MGVLADELPVFPFFVGCPRSGSTLVRAMFDSHPTLAIPPESYFIADLAQRRHRYETERGFEIGPFLGDLFAHRWFALWRLAEESTREALEAASPRSFAQAIRSVFMHYASTRGKSRFGDKTPEYVLSMSLIAELLPEATFVHIIRDGRDVALSLLGKRFSRDNLGLSALFWRLRVERGRRSGRRLGPRRYREVHYEDLLRDPGAALASLCPFLELDFQEAMLRYFERSSEILRGVPNPKAHRNLALPPTKGLRDWRVEMSREELAMVEALIGSSLARFGYELSVPRLPGRVRRHARLMRMESWTRTTVDRAAGRARRHLLAEFAGFRARASLS